MRLLQGKMLRTAVIASLCVASSLAFVMPLTMNGIPQEYKEFVPEVVQKFYKDLTPEDKQVLRELYDQHQSFNSIDQAMDALKAKSQKLYAKAAEMRDFLKNKIDSLSPENKAFINELENKLRTLRPEPGKKPDLEQLKMAAREIIGKYKALSEHCKHQLQTTFPNVAKLLKNEKFQKMAKGFLEKN